ncbi:MAG TPA: gluconate 2-dehydrogenase subunit 3 family protein, partial [Verrucomicrobiae bacterium]
MNFPGLTNDERAALNRLANAIIPADKRDAGAASVNAGVRIADRVLNGINAPAYRNLLHAAEATARETFGRTLNDLDLQQINTVVTR